ncbi:uncharacterized protein J3R85_001969 [Psidium guajava]|nr:uncharacterized protein J3R85_001969 [Psidium guajava]
MKSPRLLYKAGHRKAGCFPLLLLLSEDHAKLRRIGAGRREDLPAAGLEVVGDGAVPGEGDLVGGGGDGPELEDGDAGRPGDLDGAVHAGSFGGRGVRCSRGIGGLGLGLRFGRASEPRENTHGVSGGCCERFTGGFLWIRVLQDLGIVFVGRNEMKRQKRPSFFLSRWRKLPFIQAI